VRSAVRSSRHEDLFVLTLDHPSGIPRLSREVLRSLLEHLDEFESAREFSAMIITGTDQAFCGGAELEEITALTNADTRAFTDLGQSVMNRIAMMSKPAVAAVRGYCMGGGFDLALACHARIATADAIFAHRGATLGLITGWGGTQRLPRLIGQARAAEMFLTARSIRAEEALTYGLIRAVAAPEELFAAAARIAHALGSTSKNA
jgi:enoyl-CoA hydratase